MTPSASRSWRRHLAGVVGRCPDLGRYERIGRAAVYFLWRGQDLVYVGRSALLAHRIGQHVQAGRRFDRVTYCPLDPQDLADVEEVLIWWLRPPENKDVPPVDEVQSRRALGIFRQAVDDMEFLRRLASLGGPEWPPAS